MLGPQQNPRAVDTAFRSPPVFPSVPVLAAKLSTALTDTPLGTTRHAVWRDSWDDSLGRLERPATDPQTAAQRCDWETVAEQVETASLRAIESGR